MSSREALAFRIADFIDEHRLARVFGGRQSVNKAGRYYGVMLSLPRTLDGFIRVYGEQFILVELHGPFVGGQRRDVYKSEEDVLKFLRALLVDYDEEAANAVPTRG